jgi:hypothetical protein
LSEAIFDGDGLELWTADRLGRETGLGKRKIYRYHAEAGLPGVRVGGRLYFRPAAVMAYLDARTEINANERAA